MNEVKRFDPNQPEVEVSLLPVCGQDHHLVAGHVAGVDEILPLGTAGSLPLHPCLDGEGENEGEVVRWLGDRHEVVLTVELDRYALTGHACPERAVAVFLAGRPVRDRR